MGRFSVTAGVRDLAVCRANGAHAEPDLRGRCFMCGLLLPDPELVETPRTATGAMIVASSVVVDLDAYYRPETGVPARE